MTPVTPWLHDRPVRNRNPGDLRPRSHNPAWPGQSDIDTAPGGPFAMFATNADGWSALGLWTLYAYEFMGLKTVISMIDVFAPPSENDTAHYAQSVAEKIGAAAIDPHDAAARMALCQAIAHYEDARAPWLIEDIKLGMMLCARRWPSFALACRTPVLVVQSKTADDLNDQEFARIKPA